MKNPFTHTPGRVGDANIRTTLEKRYTRTLHIQILLKAYIRYLESEVQGKQLSWEI
jgi:hypothetical protein